MEKNLYKVMVLIERIDVGGEGPPALNGEHMYGKTEAGHLVFAACHSKADTIQSGIGSNLPKTLLPSTITVIHCAFPPREKR
jgi:hypothetical protein